MGKSFAKYFKLSLIQDYLILKSLKLEQIILKIIRRKKYI